MKTNPAIAGLRLLFSLILILFTQAHPALGQPTIVLQPQSQTVYVGSPCSLTALGLGPAPQTPNVSSGALQLWLAADMGVETNSSGQVSDWPDQSGSGSDALQSDPNEQPILVNPVGLGGRPAVRFNGIQDGINGSYLWGPNSVTVPNAMTVFTVYNAFSTANRENLIWDIGVPGNAEANRIATIFTNYMAFTFWGTDYDATFAVPTNTYRILTDELDTNQNALAIFDTTLSSSNQYSMSVNGASAVGGGYYIGGLNSFISGVGSSRCFDGDIAEVIVFSGMLSTSDRLAVQSYLEEKYFQTESYGVAYQWQVNSTIIPGATNPVLDFAFAQTNDAGSYSVIMTDSQGSVISSIAVLNVEPPPPCDPAPSGLVSWWQASGNANDSTGTNDGTPEGGLSYGPGEVGQAFNFNGTSAYVLVPASTSLNIGEDSGLTIECWINPDSTNSGFPLLEWNNGSSIGTHFWISAGPPSSPAVPGSLYANIIDTLGNYHYFLTSGGIVGIGSFQHVALTYDKASGMATLYYNGMAVATTNLGTFTPQTSYNLYVGHRSELSYYYPGLMDEICLYNRALTSSEIQGIYNSSFIGKCGFAPYITSQPQNQTVLLNTTSGITVTNGGTYPMTYQWSFNGTAIIGATNSTLVLTNFGSNAVGNYAVAISNAYGFANSSNALLSLVLPPTINVQPQSQSAGLYNSATFITSASGQGQLDYQWTFNGSKISNATNSSYIVSSVQGSSSGSYRVVVSNAYASVTSSIAVLTVVTTAVEIVNISAGGGTTVQLPIQLLSAGNENSLYFSLNYSNADLTYLSTTLGTNATGAFLIPNTSQTNGGKLGIQLALSGSSQFSMGTQQLAVVNFAVAQVTNAVNTPITFGSSPTIEKVMNGQSLTLPAYYSNGAVSLSATAIEGDVAPRTNGDGQLLLNDWYQEGRFVAALDITSNASEFARADCAPRATFGDGLITVADLVQVGRYVAGLDPLTFVNTRTATGTISNTPSASRILSLSPLTQGQITNTVNLLLASQGNENALACTVAFDPVSVNFLGATLGSAASGALLEVNSNQVASGTLGLAVALLPGSAFSIGTQQVVQLNFQSIGYSNNTPLSLTDVPVPRQVADANANILPVSFQNTLLAQAGSAWPLLSITPSGTNIALSWPASATAFTLQGTFSLSQNWSNVAGTPLSNANNMVLSMPAPINTEFFRLKH